MSKVIRIIGFVLLVLSSSVFGADIQELFPDNNVSVKYLVEFRARSGVPGHAFVALGRELDNGLVVFEAVGGFYPKDGDNKLTSVKNIAYGPGVVDFKWKDLDSDAVLRVPVAQDQSVRIAEQIGAWNDKDYSLISQNCVDMAKAVATTIGIDTKGTSAVPYDFVKSLQTKYQVLVQQRADADSAHREEQRRKEEESRKAEQARKAEEARKADAARRARAIESAQRAIEQQRQLEAQRQQIEQARRMAEQAEMARRAVEQAEAARRAAEAARQQPVIIPRLP